MQALYDAVMALGRSAEDARNGGWLCGALGSHEGPKCVNGLVTLNLTWPIRYYNHGYMPLGHSPMMMGEVTYFANLPDYASKAGRIAAIALIKTRPMEHDDALLEQWEGHDRRHAEMVLAEPGDHGAREVGSMLASINDICNWKGDPLLTGETASDWFWRAFDLLAKDLPEPLPALTVDTILAARSTENVQV